MNLRTRYRILFNGEQYKIQYMSFKLTWFKHWKREWVDFVYSGGFYPLMGLKWNQRLYRSLERAKEVCKERKERINELRINEKLHKKEVLAMKKNLWKKVWP